MFERKRGGLFLSTKSIIWTNALAWWYANEIKSQCAIFGGSGRDMVADIRKNVNERMNKRPLKRANEKKRKISSNCQMMKPNEDRTFLLSRKSNCIRAVAKQWIQYTKHWNAFEWATIYEPLITTVGCSVVFSIRVYFLHPPKLPTHEHKYRVKCDVNENKNKKNRMNKQQRNRLKSVNPGFVSTFCIETRKCVFLLFHSTWK